MISAVLQKLIDTGLFDRIPATFSTFFFEQIKDWDTLFPAERNYFERLFTLIGKLPPEEFDELFSPLRQLEPKMGVNEKNWPRRSFKLDQVDFLNRNPTYAGMACRDREDLFACGPSTRGGRTQARTTAARHCPVAG